MLLYSKIKKRALRLKFLKGKPLLWMQIAKGFYRGMVLKKNVLRSVEFAMLYKCNMKCEKCYARDLYDSKNDGISIEDIKSIWKQCHDLGAMHVNVTGGEPLIRKDIVDVVKALKPESTMISLVTNSLLLTREKVFELKKAGLNSLHLSLDSHIPEVHDKLRGVKGIYDKVMQGAEWAHEAKLVVCFSHVVCPETIDDLPKMIELAKSKGAFLILCTAGTSGGWEGKAENLLTKEQLLRNDRIREETDITTQDLEFNFSGKRECPAGREKIYISCHGDVYPCDTDHKPFGNVFKEPLKDIHKKMCQCPTYKDGSPICIRYKKVYES